MRIDNATLLAIMRLGYETLIRGDALSLHTVFEGAGHTKFIDELRRSKVARLLRAYPDILQHWIRYSENKPIKGGYWLRASTFEVGAAESPEAGVMYSSIQEAVAEFIARELGYWSEVGQHDAASPELPTVDDLVKALDQKRKDDLGRAETRLFNDYGLEALIPGLIAAYGKIQGWLGRNAILFWLIRFARVRPEVLALALAGLKDAAFLVRIQSCIMLAYSQREDMIPHLEQLLSHKDKKTRDYAQSAIEHIRNKTVFYEFQDTCLPRNRKTQGRGQDS